jgi:N-acetylneuraminic acid mutarotase
MKQPEIFLVTCLVCWSIILTSVIPIAIATVDSWTTLTPMPTARQQLGTATVDGKIFAIGGRNEFNRYLGTNEMYDPATNTWVKKAPMPTPRNSFAIAVYENKIYVIGGETNLPRGNGDTGISSINQAYDPATDTWETKASMPTPRSQLGASVVDGKIYLMGGVQIDQNYPDYYSTMNEVYDPKTDTWTTKPSLPKEVTSPVSIAIGTKIYLMGGRTFVNDISDFNQVYDTKKETWTSAKPLPTKIDAAAGASLTSTDHKIYVFGGFTDQYSNACNLTQIYDPQKDVWTYGSQMLTPHALFGVVAIGNELYAIGGSVQNFQPPSNANEKYTTDEKIIPNASVSTSPIPTPTPSVPELSWLAIVLLLLSVFAVTLIVRYRKTVELKSAKSL